MTKVQAFSGVLQIMHLKKTADFALSCITGATVFSSIYDQTNSSHLKNEVTEVLCYKL